MDTFKMEVFEQVKSIENRLEAIKHKNDLDKLRILKQELDMLKTLYISKNQYSP
jgi:hypothetical protein